MGAQNIIDLKQDNVKNIIKQKSGVQAMGVISQICN